MSEHKPDNWVAALSFYNGQRIVYFTENEIDSFLEIYKDCITEIGWGKTAYTLNPHKEFDEIAYKLHCGMIEINHNAFCEPYTHQPLKEPFLQERENSRNKELYIER